MTDASDNTGPLSRVWAGQMLHKKSTVAEVEFRSRTTLSFTLPEKLQLCSKMYVRSFVQRLLPVRVRKKRKLSWNFKGRRGKPTLTTALASAMPSSAARNWIRLLKLLINSQNVAMCRLGEGEGNDYLFIAPPALLTPYLDISQIAGEAPLPGGTCICLVLMGSGVVLARDINRVATASNHTTIICQPHSIKQIVHKEPKLTEPQLSRSRTPDTLTTGGRLDTVRRIFTESCNKTQCNELPVDLPCHQSRQECDGPDATISLNGKETKSDPSVDITKTVHQNISSSYSASPPNQTTQLDEIISNQTQYSDHSDRITSRKTERDSFTIPDSFRVTFTCHSTKTDIAKGESVALPDTSKPKLAKQAQKEFTKDQNEALAKSAPDPIVVSEEFVRNLPNFPNANNCNNTVITRQPRSTTRHKEVTDIPSAIIKHQVTEHHGVTKKHNVITEVQTRENTHHTKMCEGAALEICPSLQTSILDNEESDLDTIESTSEFKPSREDVLNLVDKETDFISCKWEILCKVSLNVRLSTEMYAQTKFHLDEMEYYVNDHMKAQTSSEDSYCDLGETLTFRMRLMLVLFHAVIQHESASHTLTYVYAIHRKIQTESEKNELLAIYYRLCEVDDVLSASRRWCPVDQMQTFDVIHGRVIEVTEDVRGKLKQCFLCTPSRSTRSCCAREKMDMLLKVLAANKVFNTKRKDKRDKNIPVMHIVSKSSHADLVTKLADDKPSENSALGNALRLKGINLMSSFHTSDVSQDDDNLSDLHEPLEDGDIFNESHCQVEATMSKNVTNKIQLESHPRIHEERRTSSFDRHNLKAKGTELQNQLHSQNENDTHDTVVEKKTNTTIPQNSLKEDSLPESERPVAYDLPYGKHSQHNNAIGEQFTVEMPSKVQEDCGNRSQHEVKNSNGNSLPKQKITDMSMDSEIKQIKIFESVGKLNATQDPPTKESGQRMRTKKRTNNTPTTIHTNCGSRCNSPEQDEKVSSAQLEVRQMSSHVQADTKHSSGKRKHEMIVNDLKFNEIGFKNKRAKCKVSQIEHHGPSVFDKPKNNRVPNSNSDPRTKLDKASDAKFMWQCPAQQLCFPEFDKNIPTKQICDMIEHLKNKDNLQGRKEKLEKEKQESVSKHTVLNRISGAKMNTTPCTSNATSKQTKTTNGSCDSVSRSPCVTCHTENKSPSFGTFSFKISVHSKGKPSYDVFDIKGDCTPDPTRNVAETPKLPNNYQGTNATPDCSRVSDRQKMDLVAVENVPTSRGQSNLTTKTPDGGTKNDSGHSNKNVTCVQAIGDLEKQHPMLNQTVKCSPEHYIIDRTSLHSVNTSLISRQQQYQYPEKATHKERNSKTPMQKPDFQIAIHEKRSNRTRTTPIAKSPHKKRNGQKSNESLPKSGKHGHTTSRQASETTSSHGRVTAVYPETNSLYSAKSAIVSGKQIKIPYETRHHNEMQDSELKSLNSVYRNEEMSYQRRKEWKPKPPSRVKSPTFLLELNKNKYVTYNQRKVFSTKSNQVNRMAKAKTTTCNPHVELLPQSTGNGYKAHDVQKTLTHTVNKKLHPDFSMMKSTAYNTKEKQPPYRTPTSPMKKKKIDICTSGQTSLHKQNPDKQDATQSDKDKTQRHPSETVVAERHLKKKKTKDRHLDKKKCTERHPGKETPNEHLHKEIHKRHPDQEKRKETHRHEVKTEEKHPNMAKPEGRHPHKAKPEGRHPHKAKPEGRHPHKEKTRKRNPDKEKRDQKRPDEEKQEEICPEKDEYIDKKSLEEKHFVKKESEEICVHNVEACAKLTGVEDQEERLQKSDRKDERFPDQEHNKERMGVNCHIEHTQSNDEKSEEIGDDEPPLIQHCLADVDMRLSLVHTSLRTPLQPNSNECQLSKSKISHCQNRTDDPPYSRHCHTTMANTGQPFLHDSHSVNIFDDTTDRQDPRRRYRGRIYCNPNQIQRKMNNNPYRPPYYGNGQAFLNPYDDNNMQPCNFFSTQNSRTNWNHTGAWNHSLGAPSMTRNPYQSCNLTCVAPTWSHPTGPGYRVPMPLGFSKASMYTGHQFSNNIQ